MATLDSLKQALRKKATAVKSSPTQTLSDLQYSTGFDVLLQKAGQQTYQDFIIPQLSLLLALLLKSRMSISVLEVGPGPESVLGSLSGNMRRKIKKYAAFEPNEIFATQLEEWLCPVLEAGSPLPCLETQPNILRMQFPPDSKTTAGVGTTANDSSEKFDIVLFCHSMYGMKPKRKFIESALDMLVEQPEGGVVVAFHRDGSLHLDGLVCHRTASLPTGVVSVVNDDDALDSFAAFVAGFSMQGVDAGMAIKIEWRRVCRAFGRRDDDYPGQIVFSAPEIMTAFDRHAITLPELTTQMSEVSEHYKIKSPEARFHHPASIVKPTEILHVQQCVRWALRYGFGLTIVGGSHSGQCLWPNVVGVDMGAFGQLAIVDISKEDRQSYPAIDALVVVGSGCKSGTIVRETMAAGLTVPLGARPSVGAGLWLQGGIGHLARRYGLACDAIVGAVMVSVASGQVLCVGHVPSQHQPVGAVRPSNDSDLLWAMKGAGTNFGIVISVTFKAFTAPTYTLRSWTVPLNDDPEARLQLHNFDTAIATSLPRDCSADAFLYWDTDKLRLGVTVFDSSRSTVSPAPVPTPANSRLGTGESVKTADGVELFDADMYMSQMHGGHGGGKTSSFKRCIFLKRIGAVEIADIFISAMKTRPLSLCYLHLLHGGGSVGDVAEDATAFGCRNWDFACVITGVWPREQDGTDVARAATQWVYNVVKDLLPLSCGVYGADLGPDPRDAVLAARAFGPNLPRLARLKRMADPENVLAYACPIPKRSIKEKLIFLVTGKSGDGKDYSADHWARVFIDHGFTAKVASISDEMKREYAAVTGADLDRLLCDRAYKEQHRPMLWKYFNDQVQRNPRLPEETFLDIVHNAGDVDVLIITGMRDETPLATYSPLVPDSKMVEVTVKASTEARRARGEYQGGSDCDADRDPKCGVDGKNCPSLMFNNDMSGHEAATRFCEDCLLPLCHEDLQHLASMVPLVPNFPRPGIEFRHVLEISQRPGGLTLCTSLLKSHFTGDWAKVDVLACCETGGLIYASALAAQVDVPLALIRESGRLPTPTVSVIKSPSHISSLASDGSKEKTIELGRDVIRRGASVLVVDDVLATGKTLCAVLDLLKEAGVSTKNMHVMVVAEFPVHRGRELLCQRGFGGNQVQSLLVFGGA